MAGVALLERAKQLGFALLWITAFAIVGIVAIAVLLQVVSPPTLEEDLLVWNGLLGVPAFWVATWLVGRRLAKRSWHELGWVRGAALARWLLRGTGVGLGMAACAIGLAVVLSGASLHLTNDGATWLPAAAWLAVGLVTAALTEELMFRGFPLRRLADAIGPWAATLLVASGFGVAHVGNPSASFFGIVNIVLAGVWLSLAFFSAGGMAYAWGLHFGWNAGLAAPFDAPVSGHDLAVPGVEYEPGVRAWIDGGAFGPEGGLVATIALLLGTAVVLGRRLREPRTWVTA